jgi:TolB protein
MLYWAPDSNTLLYTEFLPGSHPDCYHDPSLPSHEDLVYAPELAKGGTHLCVIDPFSGMCRELTQKEEGKWEHHAVFSPDGSYIYFSRAYTGGDNELWAMGRDGGGQHLLTKGYEGRGAVIYEHTDIKLKIPV